MTPLLALFLLVTGVDKRQSGTAARICLLALLGTLAGYFFVYLTTPLPLDWLVETSLNRVLMQLWPSTLFLIFLCTRTPNVSSGTSYQELTLGTESRPRVGIDKLSCCMGIAQGRN